jgi:hypothetical protein
MVQALFDRKILMDYLNSGFLADDPAVWMLYKLLAIAMMNEDQKRASFSATPVFAELRQLTNEIEEARQYLILSIACAHKGALGVEDADLEKNGKTTARSDENLADSVST